MANHWLRLWHDMPNDPKWRTVARIAEQPISLVLSVYVHLLVEASRNVTRGHAAVTSEDLASALDTSEDAINAILDAMQGRLLDEMYLMGWEKRQPKKEDAGDESNGAKSAAQRKAEQRAREKAARELVFSQHDVTESHAESREVTTDKDKDKDKENQNTMTPQSADPEDVRLCPVGSLVDLYHECMPENPRVKVLNDKRKAAIRARWKDAAKFDFAPFGYKTKSEGLSKWRTFFEVCAESDFMTGKVTPAPGRKLFIADIDFIFSPDGFAKILENKYHQRQA
jgi:hypothetical protein